ncbi:hypothetical protein [Nocardia sp. BMG51109]|uniref:hypothetical protein n=1 Tax=Nocardia sp. BMG51109 TaxID=1056816 RepID=UPI0004644993|nr:hypothetical protein [Nocardia sp. BMG51109]
MRFNAILAATAAVLTGAAASMTAAPPASADPWPACDFVFYEGFPYLKEPAAVIVGGYTECRPDRELYRFHISLTLEYRRGGRWIVQGAEQSDQIPRPRVNIATWAPCENGAWQGVAAMWETAPDGRTLSHSRTSSHAIIQC